MSLRLFALIAGLMIFLHGLSQKPLVQPAKDSASQLTIARIQYIYKAKQASGNSAWASFGDEQYNIPLIYYTGNTTFISNPHQKFLRKFNPRLVFENKKLSIFRLDFRIDTVPFHMITDMSVEGDTSSYQYFSPYIKCSSREEFEARTAFKANTQQWAAIVLHEFFHGFQFSHKGYLRQAMQDNFINLGIGENLQKLYAYFEWFKEGIDKENNLLLKAIESTRQDEMDSLVREFFTVRNKRRLRTKTETNNDIDLFEKSFETVEGTARFTEIYFLTHPIGDKELRSIDNNFDSGNNTPYKIPEDLFKTEASAKYYYATGYNMTRLLKKMKIGYDKVLFTQTTLTLEDMLKQLNTKL